MEFAGIEPSQVTDVSDLPSNTSVVYVTSSIPEISNVEKSLYSQSDLNSESLAAERF